MMRISKVLTSNDVGATGSHQAGIVIPSQIAECGFFPTLNHGIINPRIQISVEIPPTGSFLKINYIYYNGRLHGTSTRNEFRITGLTGFLKSQGAFQGDSLTFSRDAGGHYSMILESAEESSKNYDDVIVLRLNAWTLKGAKA